MKHQATRLIAIFISALVVFTALIPSASCSAQRESVWDTISNETSDEDSGYDEYVYEENVSVNGKETQFKEIKAKYTRNHYSKSSGKLEWSVTLTATFYYDYNTSDCASASVSVNIYDDTRWSLARGTQSASRSGNTATGKATLIEKILLAPIHKAVTLTMTCDKNGNITRN